MAISSKIDCLANFAYTQRPQRIDRYDQIQICPWFLQWAVAQDYKTKADYKPSFMSNMALRLDDWITGKWYTPIDLISLFDKVILHEVSVTVP